MTLEEIKTAVEDGQKVYHKTRAYEVIKDRIGQWFIKCNLNDYLIGLTWADKVTMNGKPEDFFMEPPRNSRYPFIIAIDYLRDVGGVDKDGLRLNRSDASRMLDAIAIALGWTKDQMAVTLADYAMANSDRLAKEAADRLITAIR